MDRAETPRPLQMAQPQPVTAGLGGAAHQTLKGGFVDEAEQLEHAGNSGERAHFLPSSPPAGNAPDLIPQRSHDKTPKPGDWGLSAAEPPAAIPATTLGSEHIPADHHQHALQHNQAQQQQQQQHQQGLFGWFKSAFNGLAPTPAAMGMMRASSPPATEAQLFAARQRGGTPRIRNGGNNASPSSGESARLFGRRGGAGLGSGGGRKGHAEDGSGGSSGAGEIVSGIEEERSAQNNNSADLTEARSSYRADRRRTRPRLPAADSGGAVAAAGEDGPSPSASARSSMALSDSGDYYDDDDDDDEDDDEADDGRRYADSEEEDNSDSDSINTEEELYTPFESRNLPPVIVRPSARREGAALALGPPDSPTEELRESQAMLGNAHAPPTAPTARGSGIKSVSSAHNLGDPQLMEGNQVVIDATPPEDSFPPSVVLTPPPPSEGALRRPMDGDGSRELEGLSLGAAGQSKPSKEAVVLGSRAANVREGKMESVSGGGSGSGSKSNTNSGGTTPVGGVSEWEDDRSKTPRPGAPLSTNAPSTSVTQHPRIPEDSAAEIVDSPVQENQAPISFPSDSKKAKRAERKYLSEASALPSSFSSISTDSSSSPVLADDAGSGPAKKGFFSRSRDPSTSSSAAGSGGALSRTNSRRLSRSGSLSGEKGEKGEKRTNWLFGASRSHRRSISTASSSAASISSGVAPGSDGGHSNAASSNLSNKKESKKEKNKAKGLRRAESGHGQGISEASSIASSLASTDDAASTRSHGGNSSIGRNSQASSLKSDGKPKKLKIRYKNKSSKDRNFDKVFLAQELQIGSSARISRKDSLAPSTSNASSLRSDGSPARPPFVSQHSIASLSSTDGAFLPNGRPLSVHSTAPSVSSTTSRNKGRATWAMRWSPCGRYLAVAGQDCVIFIYEVLSAKQARQAEVDMTRMRRALNADGGHSNGSANSKKGKNTTDSSVKDHFPVFSSTPVRELRGHTLDILDISWSKNNFLLSASMDKTAKLWHISRDECLCTFAHLDFVTATCFHPKDDRFFLSGSLDGKLRLWNIPAKKVQASQEVPGLITACTFTQSGATACVGTFAGAALFYDTERLTYSTSIAVRSSSGKHARGRKITGIEPIWTPDGSEKVLITSNDSRIRVYDLKQKRLARKFKGASYLNRTSQIRASISEDGNFVIAGSEDAHVYIWDAGAGPSSLLSLDTLQGKGKNSDPPYEYWTAHPGTVTCALVAPLKAHTFLEASEDPISIHASMQQAGKVSQSTTTALTAMSLASAISAAVPHQIRPAGSSAQPTPAFDAKRNRIVCTVDESSKLRVWRADSYQVLRNMAPMLEALPHFDAKNSE